MVGAAALAGRVYELREVTQLLRGGSQHAAMLVIGEAGVGKSRLVTAAAGSIASDVLVLSGWCLPLSNRVPFLPLADLLRELDEIDNGRLLTVALDNCQPFVRDEVLRLMPDAQDQPVGPTPASDGWSRQRLFEATRRFFSALPQLRRVAIAVEDVQWADTTTLEFLDYLLAPGRATGVPMVLTCRSEEAQSKTLIGWLERLHRNQRVRRLELAPLTVEETAEQIALLLGARPSPMLIDDTYARSEGNAFFTEQIVAAASADGEPGVLPAGLGALLLSRVAQVDDAGRDVLAALAVAARPLDESAIVRLCDRPDHEVRQALRDLRTRRLLRRPDGAGRHQLRHSLLGEAIYGDLLPSERSELHGRVADLMEDWHDPSVAAQIAEHVAAAGRPGDELGWRVRAARYADAVYAFREAAEHWQRAVALSDDVPITQTVEGLSLAQLYGAAQDALELSGNDEAANQLAEAALERLSDADPASQADVMARAGGARGVVAPDRGLELLYRSLAIYQRLPPSAGHVKALGSVAWILGFGGRAAEAADMVDQAAALAIRAGLRAEYLQLLGAQALYEAFSGKKDVALRRIRTLRERVTDQDEPAVDVWLAIVHANVLFSLNRLPEVPEAATSALQIATERGIEQSFRVAMLREFVCTAFILRGQVDGAAQLIEPLTQGVPGLSNSLDYEIRALVETLRGNLDGAQQRWAQIEELPAATLTFRRDTGIRHAELDLWRGAPEVAFERAHTLLVQSASAGHLHGQLMILGMRGCADLADVARATRDVEGMTVARRCADQLNDLHRRVDPNVFEPGPPSWPSAVAEKLTWQAEWSRLKGQSNASMWEQSAAAWDAIARPHEAAYARWRQAEALLTMPGGRASAAAVLRTAAEQATQHVPLSNAIHNLARRARVELAVHAEPPPTPAEPHTEAARYGLTDRELLVLRLVAAGRSNGEIGAELFISRKTASVHVSNILRKLGVSTRVQAAALAERAGILEEL
jgi:DNA-binding CsgD family transcriptional regulator/tetratricopeptide (TPR) repeat protein